MIPLTKTQTPVTMSSGVKSSTYSIALTGKTFDVLSSMLYKDPILAIVREISCNAMDSHVTNNNVETPFDIHLPNTVEPYFSIRDYGTGMSAEQIDSVYTKFFESTKTTSNDVVGALGLGSKSPFSYTSNYTVTSWHNGLKLVYSAFKSADGIPSIALLDVNDTTEPSGLEVQFAVKSPDFTKFTEKVQTFFTTWCSVPPNVIGGTQGRITLKQIEREFGGDNWLIAKSGSPLYTAIAIQGNVPYPLQRNTICGSNAFRDRFTSDNQRTLIQRLLELPIIIQFPIGSLDFSASREELQYTELTVAAILDKLVEISKDILTHISAEAATKATQWDILEYARALRQDRLSNVIRYVGANQLAWKGKLIDISINTITPDITKLTVALALHPLQMTVNSRRKLESVGLFVSKIEKDAQGDIKSVEAINTDLKVSPGSGVITIAVCNELKGYASKVKYHFLNKINSQNGMVFCISPKRGEKITDFTKFNKAVNDLLDAFDVPGSKVNVVWTSNLTPPPHKTRAQPISKVDDTFKVLNASLTNSTCQDKFSTFGWTSIDKDTITTHVAAGTYAVVYVPIIRGVPVHISTKPDSMPRCVRYVYNDHFVDLWNTLAATVAPKRVLLIGVKSSLLANKKVQAVLQTMQSLEAFIRFWMYENATATTEANALHTEWINNSGGDKLLMQAFADMSDVNDKAISTIAEMIQQFKCDKTKQQLLLTTRNFIGLAMRTLRECDRVDGVTDDVLTKMDSVMATAQVLAKDKYSELNKRMNIILEDYPMLSYVDNAMRYNNSTAEKQAACKQIQTYIKLVNITTQKG